MYFDDDGANRRNSLTSLLLEVASPLTRILAISMAPVTLQLLMEAGLP